MPFRWCPVCVKVRALANFCPKCGRAMQDVGRVRGVIEQLRHWVLQRTPRYLRLHQDRRHLPIFPDFQKSGRLPL